MKNEKEIDKKLEQLETLLNQEELQNATIPEQESFDSLVELQHEILQYKDDGDDRGIYLLQRCCKKNLPKVAKWLIEKGTKVIGTTEEHPLEPLEVACQESKEELIEILLEELRKYKNMPKYDEIICISLCKLIKRIAREKPENMFERSFQLFIDLIKEQNINIEQYSDGYGFTPLFYANYYQLSDIHVRLLETVSLMDTTKVLDKINHNILKKYLDKCVFIKGFDEIYINYETLYQNPPFSESNFFFEVSLKKEFQALLLHPVTLVFLFLTWRQNCIYKLCFCLEMAFWIILIVILCLCSFTNNLVLKIVSAIILCVSQIIVHICNDCRCRQCKPGKTKLVVYIKSFLTQTFTSLSVLILIIISWFANEEGAKMFLSVTVMLIPFKIISLLRIHTTYAETFLSVMRNFFKLIVLFAGVLLLPFTVSCHVIFSDKTNSTDNSLPNFETFLGTFYNVFTLLNADFNFNFSKEYSIIQHFFAIIFVFIFAVVLINLFISHAVTDVQELKHNAEIACTKEKIKFIHHINSLYGSKKYCPIKRLFQNPTEPEDGTKRTVLEIKINCKKVQPTYINLDKEVIESLNSFQDTNDYITQKFYIYSAALKPTAISKDQL